MSKKKQVWNPWTLKSLISSLFLRCTLPCEDFFFFPFEFPVAHSHFIFLAIILFYVWLLFSVFKGRSVFFFFAGMLVRECSLYLQFFWAIPLFLFICTIGAVESSITTKKGETEEIMDEIKKLLLLEVRMAYVKRMKKRNVVVSLHLPMLCL